MMPSAPVASAALPADPAVLGLINLAYATVEDAAAWSPFLTALRAATGCQDGVASLSAVAGRERAHLAVSSGREEAALPGFREHRATEDVRLRSGTPDSKRPGAVRPGQALAADDGVRRSARMSVSLGNQDSPTAVLTLVYPDASPCGPECLNLLAQLAPHVSNALRLHELLARHAVLQRAMMDALDQLPVAFFLVDDTGRILHHSREAKRLLRAHDGLLCRDGRLACEERTDDDALRQLLRGGGGVLPVTRRSGEASLTVRVSPVSVEGPLASFGGAMVVLVTDPVRQPAVQPAVIQRLFGVTRAEADICGELLAGKSPEEMADARHVDIQTVRSQLKTIFGKTDTKGQVGLLGLLLKSVAHWQEGEADQQAAPPIRRPHRRRSPASSRSSSSRSTARGAKTAVRVPG